MRSKSENVIQNHVTGNTSVNIQHMNSGFTPNSGISNTIGSIADDRGKQKSIPLNEKINTKDADGNFLAPNISNGHPQSNNYVVNNKMLCIHIGPFMINVQSDDIVAHILNRAGVSTDLFIVEKLIGKHDDIRRKTFVSFKISTFSNDVFNLLLNNEIWGPHKPLVHSK